MASIVVFRFGPPEPTLRSATICWMLFALPANLAAGNILSITLAYRMTLTRLSREARVGGQRAAEPLDSADHLSRGSRGVCAAGVDPSCDSGRTVAFGVGRGQCLMWLRGLANVDEMLNGRREALTGDVGSARYEQ